MRRTLSWTLSVATALVFLSPLMWLFVGSFREETHLFSGGPMTWLSLEHWTWHNYPNAWRRADLGQGLVISLIQVALIAGAGLFCNAAAAYAFARLTFRGREIAFSAIVILIILPVEVIAVPLFFTARDLGLTGDFSRAMAGLTLPFIAKAFNIYFLRQHFLTLPKELEEAAAIEGAGAWRQFWSVALPAIRPALATVVLIDVLFHWGDFLWPLLISTREETRTLQLSLANLYTQPPIQWGQILACAVMATLPIVLLFRLLQRYMVASETSVGIK